MPMDAIILSRIQFAITIMFHYLFPPLTIGMGAFLVFLEARYLKTKNPQFEAAANFGRKFSHSISRLEWLRGS